MVRHTLKILQQLLQDFESVSDHFGTLCIKALISSINPWTHVNTQWKTHLIAKKIHPTLSRLTDQDFFSMYFPSLIKNMFLTLFWMGLFRAAHGWGGQKRPPIPKICHTYPTIMKLGIIIPYLRKTQKIYESRDTPFEFCWNQHFFIGNQ